MSGYAVGSLALVADSFHMLKYASFNLNFQITHITPDSSDVMSLVVALYAIKARHSRFFFVFLPLNPLHLQLTNGNSKDPRYSYGWHRAEILAALINGVFLLALCFSIFLEAIGRFFTTPGP